MLSIVSVPPALMVVAKAAEPAAPLRMVLPWPMVSAPVAVLSPLSVRSPAPSLLTLRAFVPWAN